MALPADPRASPLSLHSGAIEGAAPGTAALFRGLAEDRSHAVLDLGAATDQSLHVYGRFARWIHFADLLGEPWSHHQSAGGLQLPRLDRTFDLVFAWDILDRLYSEARARLVQWLSEVTAPKARLHVVVRGSEEDIARPLRFTLLDIGRIRCEPAGTAR